MPREIIFLIEESDDEGYEAKALGFSIYTEAETFEELKENIKDAIKCHLDDKKSLERETSKISPFEKGGSGDLIFLKCNELQQN